MPKVKMHKPRSIQNSQGACHKESAISFPIIALSKWKRSGSIKRLLANNQLQRGHSVRLISSLKFVSVEARLKFTKAGSIPLIIMSAPSLLENRAEHAVPITCLSHAQLWERRTC